MPKKEMIGKRFGRLTVISESEQNGQKLQEYPIQR